MIFPKQLSAPSPLESTIVAKPGCCAQTSGPQVQAGKALNVGVAAHISGAAPGGPRYDTALAPQARADIANGVWLCQTCAKLVDNHPARFTAERAGIVQALKAQGY